jgi:hypothetical protein
MVNPFPSPYPTLLGANPRLQTACLDKAIDEALVEFPSIKPFRTAISMVAIDETTSPFDFKHAGVRYGDSFYTASLVKVGVLYAAYELRQRVNILAAEKGITEENMLYAQLKNEFDEPIEEKFRSILKTLKKLNPITESVVTPPNYQAIFRKNPQENASLKWIFTDPFYNNLVNMIVKGENNAAAFCIQALGYSWINGTLTTGGFFFPEGQTGIWVGGTFTGALTPVRIHSENDENVAQASTCFDMANLYAHLVNQTLVNHSDVTNSREMLNLLFVSAATGNNESFLDWTRRKPLPERNFTVTHSKIGLGQLKNLNWVASDAAIVEHGASGKRFIVVFQNSFRDFDSLAALGLIVDRTIERFLTSP